MEEMQNLNSCCNNEKSYKFGLHIGKRLCKILGTVLKDRHCFSLFCLVGLVSLLQEYIVYNIGLIPSGFYEVFGDKDWKGFIRHTITSLLMIIAIAFVLSSKKYIVNVLYVLTRKILTIHIQRSYFDLNKFYYINMITGNPIDNPDQRITQDIDKFSNKFSSIVSPVIIAPFTISYYSYVCFSTTGWVGPIAVLSVFVISAIINKLLIKPIMNLVILQEKCEGFFRFQHMHVRSHAESIALQGAGRAELTRSEVHFTNLVSTQQTLYLQQYPLDMSVSLFDYIGSIISYLLLASPIFSEEYSNLSPTEISSLISQNAFVTIYLISCFSSLIDLSSSISHIAGLTYRISDLLNIVNDDDILVKRHNEDARAGTVDFKESDPIVIQLKNVTFGSPSKEFPLVIGLDLTIRLGVNLLITGDSSSGKTSLIRVIRGLWTVRNGTITRTLKFVPSNIFFLSQKALLTDGTLWDQIIYPVHHSWTSSNLEDENLVICYINYVGLGHLLSKAGGLKEQVPWNWTDMLSPGEAQRLSFIRLFYHQPRLAFLDESTSAVTPEMEQRLYGKCKELNITLVTIGHRRELSQYHDLELHLDGNGNWTLVPIDR